MFYGTSILDNDFEETEKKGTLGYLSALLLYHIGWFLVWTFVIIPALLLLLVCVYCTILAAASGEMWGILFVLAFVAGGLRGLFGK
jgi:hypothetical protein